MKKHAYNQIKRKRPLFFLSGLTVALAVTFLAFEYQTETYNYQYAEDLSDFDDEFEEEMPVVILEKKVPKIAEPIKKAPSIKPVPKPIYVPLPTPVIDPSFELPMDIDFDNLPKFKDEVAEPEPAPVVIMAETPAEFITGERGFYEYISKIRLPKAYRDNASNSTIYVTFIVNTDGSVSNVEVLRDVGFGVDDAVIKHLENMPNWKPAKQGKNLVRQRFNLPINIVIK